MTYRLRFDEDRKRYEVIAEEANAAHTRVMATTDVFCDALSVVNALKCRQKLTQVLEDESW